MKLQKYIKLTYRKINKKNVCELYAYRNEKFSKQEHYLSSIEMNLTLKLNVAKRILF